MSVTHVPDQQRRVFREAVCEERAGTAAGAGATRQARGVILLTGNSKKQRAGASARTSEHDRASSSLLISERGSTPAYRLSHEADLLHQGHLVIEELLLHDLPVLPVRNRTELNLELLPVGLYYLAIGSGHRALERTGEVGDRARPVPLTEQGLVGMVPDLVVREYFEECDCFFLVG